MREEGALHLFARAALWLASGVAGLDVTGWDQVLSPGNPAYAVLLSTGAVLLLEPVWLAALTAHVEQKGSWVAGIVTGMIGSPFLLVGLVHLAAGADFVTVFGKRAAAQVAFTFRKRHAREIFALLRERTREAQDRARGASAEAQTA